MTMTIRSEPASTNVCRIHFGMLVECLCLFPLGSFEGLSTGEKATKSKDGYSDILVAKSKDFSPPLVAGYDFVCLFVWLFGRSVGQWVGWLVGRLVGWLVGRSVGWLVGWLVHGSASTTSRCPRASAQMILGIPTSAKHRKYHFEGGPLEKIGTIEHWSDVSSSNNHQKDVVFSSWSKCFVTKHKWQNDFIEESVLIMLTLVRKQMVAFYPPAFWGKNLQAAEEK